MVTFAHPTVVTVARMKCTSTAEWRRELERQRDEKRRRLAEESERARQDDAFQDFEESAEIESEVRSERGVRKDQRAHSGSEF